jgi:hypothetical protein
VLLEGRLAGRRLDNGFEAELKRLTLATRDGLTLPETDFKLSWRGAAANRPGQGAATANGLDLGVHGRFRRPPALRRRQPRPPGQACAARPVFDLKLDWTAGAAELSALQSGPSAAASRASA